MRLSYSRYFGVLGTISEAVGLKYEHIDLFFYRETEQNRFKPKIYDSETKNLAKFWRKQIELSKDLIVAVKPRVIVVANKSASDIVLKEFNLEPDTEHGYYRSQLLNNGKIPVFLGSVLSGQRALDVYSRERLIWHITKAIKQVINEQE